MASIHKDPRGKSPFWYCAYRLPGGKRVFRSTKLTEKKAALQFCRKLEQASSEAVTGRLTESRAHDLISEILEHTTGEPLRGFKVRDWFEQRDHRDRKNSPHSELKRQSRKRGV